MPYYDILNSIMQRLKRQVGLPAALEVARAVPHLVVDAAGSVLDFDRSDPWRSVRLLGQQYERVAAAPVDLPARPPADMAPDAIVPAPPTRLLIVDDHVLVREGLANLLEMQPDMQVLGQAGSVREAIALAQSSHPDVILMDFTLPDGTGDQATREILAALPGTKIVFLTVHDDDERLFAAISAGAIGYLLKSVRSAELVNWLRGVVRGDMAFSPSIGQRILGRLSHMSASPPNPAKQLTEREAEILRLIVQGHTNRDIADALNLSVRTVEYHRANLTSKLNLHSRADLVRYATENGLLDPSAPASAPGPERRPKR